MRTRSQHAQATRSEAPLARAPTKQQGGTVPSSVPSEGEDVGSHFLEVTEEEFSKFVDDAATHAGITAVALTALSARRSAKRTFDALAVVPDLRDLRLGCFQSSAALKTAAPRLATLTALQALELPGGALTADVAAALSKHLPGMPCLRHLTLRAVKLTNEHVRLLAKLTAITRLSVLNSPLVDGALPKLLLGTACMPALQRLDLDGSSINGNKGAVSAAPSQHTHLSLRGMVGDGFFDWAIGLLLLPSSPALRSLDISSHGAVDSDDDPVDDTVLSCLMACDLHSLDVSDGSTAAGGSLALVVESLRSLTSLDVSRTPIPNLKELTGCLAKLPALKRVVAAELPGVSSKQVAAARKALQKVPDVTITAGAAAA